MKNNFVATFILLAAELVFNDVTSVHGKPTKRNPNGWKGWQVEQVRSEGIDAIYECHGTFSNYKDPQKCNRASRIKGTLSDGCAAIDPDPIACKILSSMERAEEIADQHEALDRMKKVN
jgi:hypothetical protein